MLDAWLGLTGQAPLPDKPLVLPVLSGSMRPAINLGSQILIDPCDATCCRVGDVTVYLDGDRLVAHRVLGFLGNKRYGWVFQKGDANRYGHWIRTDKIKGVVREVLPTEDHSQVPPGLNPFSLECAQVSRREYLRNIILAVPRRFKDLITGHKTESREGE